MTSIHFDTKNPPQDPAVLLQIITEAQRIISENEEALAEKDKALAEEREAVAYYKRRLEQELRYRYGPRSEKLDPCPHQLWLFEGMNPHRAPIEDPNPLDDDEEEFVEVKKKKKRGGRRKLPEHLPHKRIEHDLEESEKTCSCGCQMRKIGEDISERYEFVPASFFIEECVRAKYACNKCGILKTAGQAPGPLPKVQAGPGLLAEVIVSKYADHLPLYRQSDIYLRHGVDLSRVTLWHWIRDCTKLLEPICEYMKREILSGDIIWTDDTPVRVQDRSLHKKTRLGRLWIYRGDDDHPFNLIEYTPNRKGEHPQRFLAGYSGYLQADAYGGYDEIYRSSHAKEVACLAHSRRKFYDARVEDPPWAEKVLARIRSLYRIEREAKARALDARAIRDLRQQRAVPILDELHHFLLAQRGELLPKSGLCLALNYALNQWEALKRYTEDGRLHIDNNVAERNLKGIALGRKNWLFCGSDRGGQAAATLVSLIATCRRHKVEPWIYLHDALRVLGDYGPVMAHFTPLYWKTERAKEALTE